MKWHILNPQIPQNESELEKVLLTNRYISESEAEDFFAPPSPFKISLQEVGINQKQMDQALARIKKAAENKEDVLIFGDYDADGICSTAILWEALKSVGIIARPFIPHREKNGYGLSLPTLETILAERKPDLIITVDNGIVAHDAFAHLKELGISTILTDHHAPEKMTSPKARSSSRRQRSVPASRIQDEFSFPPADIILHTTKLCGGGVAWFLARSLNQKTAEVLWI